MMQYKKWRKLKTHFLFYFVISMCSCISLIFILLLGFNSWIFWKLEWCKHYGTCIWKLHLLWFSSWIFWKLKQCKHYGTCIWMLHLSILVYGVKACLAKQLLVTIMLWYVKWNYGWVMLVLWFRKCQMIFASSSLD